MKESYVVDACIKWLFAHDCYVWRNNTGGYKVNDGSGRFIRFGLKGSADILGVAKGGKFIAVECKSDKGKLSPEQITFGERITEKGGLYIVAHSTDDLETLKEKING